MIQSSLQDKKTAPFRYPASCQQLVDSEYDQKKAAFIRHFKWGVKAIRRAEMKVGGASARIKYSEYRAVSSRNLKVNLSR
jgi:hypothetical protein